MSKMFLAHTVPTEISWSWALEAVEHMVNVGKADDFCMADVRDLREAADTIEAMLKEKAPK